MSDQSKTQPGRTLGRRGVLKGAGLAAATAASPFLAGAPAQALQTKPDQTKARYQESAQVKRYYETNRR
jgi:hypothetical protein